MNGLYAMQVTPVEAANADHILFALDVNYAIAQNLLTGEVWVVSDDYPAMLLLSLIL